MTMTGAFTGRWAANPSNIYIVVPLGAVFAAIFIARKMDGAHKDFFQVFTGSVLYSMECVLAFFLHSPTVSLSV